MKILHLIPCLKKGGAERLVLNIYNELKIRKEFDVQLVTFQPDNAYSFLTLDSKFKIIPSKVVPSISKKSIIEVKELQQFITDFQPDIIHSHLFETEMVLAHIKLPKKTKRVVHFHNNMTQYKGFTAKTFFKKSLLSNFYERRIVLKSYPYNTKVIAVSKNTFDYCKSILTNTIEIKLLHNAIDLTIFNNINSNKKSIDITLIGSLKENKGHYLAFQTVHALKKRGLEIKLICLGEGTERLKLEALILELNLTNEVELLGNQDHPELFLQNSFCYLCTSKSEAFGLTLIEAMASGLPVVCTDGKGNRDLIQEGDNGFMVWSRDPEMLADKIELLLKNEALRIEMGKKAFTFAQDFGMKKYVDSLIYFYKSI